MSYKKYGKYIQILDSVPHSITKINDEINLTLEGVETSNDFLKNFRWDGSIRDSRTNEVQVKTKDESDKVYIISKDSYFGWSSLIPKGKTNPCPYWGLN